MANSSEKFKAVYFGKVLPERAWVDFKEPVKLGFQLAEDQPQYSAEIHIFLNQVTVVVKSETNIADRATLKNCVEASVQNTLDFFGYIHGHGYDVDIIAGFYEQTTENEVFGITGYLFSDDERKRRHAKLMPLFKHGWSPHIQSALADLREAIRMPADTGFFAYRAVESVMQAFLAEAGNANEKKAWETMHSALNLDEDWLKGLKPLAGNRRHGKPTAISWDDRLDAMRRTWLVMDRYFEYLARGMKPLPEKDFPIL